MGGMTSTNLTVSFALDDRAMAAAGRVLAGLKKLFTDLTAAFVEFGRAVARVLRAIFAPLAWLRRREPALLAAEMMGWKGLALRHALRPPTRGYWLKRCFCAPCYLRRFPQE